MALQKKRLERSAGQRDVYWPVGDEVRQVARRRHLSKDLPREIVSHELAPEDTLCCGCGQPMTKIREDVSEIVELIPAQFQVQEHHQAKYARSTEGNAKEQA